jgi:hypothetical protein
MSTNRRFLRTKRFQASAPGTGAVGLRRPQPNPPRLHATVGKRWQRHDLQRITGASTANLQFHIVGY